MPEQKSWIVLTAQLSPTLAVIARALGPQTRLMLVAERFLHGEQASDPGTEAAPRLYTLRLTEDEYEALRAALDADTRLD